jgi:hypothetical protein
MNAPIEQLHHELERELHSHQGVWPYGPQAMGGSAIKELATLAQALKTAPQLRVDPNFAHWLEQCLLMYHRARQHQHSAYRS